ncbi:PEP-CTERM sorting domain-containing protein [Geothermobacter hydrogeniphilus]|nr:PEP-CTERM sorting domain-containing protein [Geothermobacter hydrogeniphilus]
MLRLLVLVMLMTAGMFSTAGASTIGWTDWTAATTGASGSAKGAISVGGSNIDVAFNGVLSFAQLGTGTNFWTEGSPAPYTNNPVIDNAPTPSELLGLNLRGSYSLTFSEPVANPVMAIVSLGRINQPVSYVFDTPFTLLSEGQGWWGDGNYTLGGSNVLTGYELHAAIQFEGLLSSIKWTSAPDEYWHGITVGVPDDVAPVPEPSLMLLLGSGLAGLALLRRKEKNV